MPTIRGSYTAGSRAVQALSRAAFQRAGTSDGHNYGRKPAERRDTGRRNAANSECLKKEKIDCE